MYGNEEQLKQDVKQLVSRYGLKDFILLYAEEERIKGIADVGISVLGPHLVKFLMSKFVK